MGLQLWLPLNGNIRNQGLCDIEIEGNPDSWENGKIGKCAKFNGGQWINTERTDLFSYTDNFTWACWIIPNYQSGTHWAFTCGRADYGGYGYGLQLWLETECKIWFGSSNYSINTVNDAWQHIAFTKRENNIRIYLNGECVINTTFVGDLPTWSDGHFGIGIGCFHYSGEIYHCNSSINDFRLYDECLSPKQIKYISQAMICHYPMGNVDGKIGGRNLLMDSANNYAAIYSDYAAVSNRAIGKIEILTTDAGNAYGFIQDKFAIPPVELGLIAGTEYTYSIDIKLTGSFTNFRASIDYRTPTNTLNFRADAYTDKTGEWIRISATDVTRGIADASNSLYVFNWDTATVGSIIEYKNPKLERGNKATDWTPAPEDNPQFYDNIIPDISGYQNNATIKDSTSPTWSDDSPRYLGSYYFSAKSYLKFPNPIYDNKTIHNLTINMWVKLDSGCGGYATILSGFNSGVSNFPWICVNTEGFGLWSYIGSNTPNYGSVSNEYLSLNTWYMITYVFDSGSVYWYLNGVRKGDITKYTTLNYINADMEYLAIGNSYTGTQWDTNFCGWISDFRMFTTVLSTDDVKALYQNSASLDSQGNLMLSGEVIE